jgi:hypothetical protein
MVTTSCNAGQSMLAAGNQRRTRHRRADAPGLFDYRTYLQRQASLSTQADGLRDWRIIDSATNGPPFDRFLAGKSTLARGLPEQENHFG